MRKLEAVRPSLLVEDDPELRKLVNGYLRNVNYDVFEASDGSKAMSALSAQRFDLVVLDLVLPASSGFEVLEFMRRRGLAIPVLMISARSMPEERAHAEELGATLYLTKPFTRTEFARAVKSMNEVSHG